MNLFDLNRVPSWIWAALYLLVAGAAVYALRFNWAYDDPFITYRYARNLADGLGFVYNPGERVLSTTTPLFTLLLAAVALLRLDTPAAANLIGAISIAAGGLLLFDLARSYQTPLVGWLALILYPAVPLLQATIGSETPLFIALCLACFAAYVRNIYSGVALFAALAVLARPDGLLVVGLLALHYFLFRRREAFPLRSLQLFFAIVLGWVLFAWLYFGSPIPATLAAKQHQGLMAISQRFPLGLVRLAQDSLSSPLGFIQIGLALVGLGYAVCCARRWALLLAWPLTYILAYTVLGVTTYFWYYAPLVPAFVILIGLGVNGLYLGLVSVLKRSERPPGRTRAAARAALVLFILALVVVQVRAALLDSLRTDPRHAVYRDLGLWLREHTPYNALVGALEIGIIGYYAERPMLDFAGLIQSDVAQYLAYDTTYEDSAAFAIERYHPDFLVLNSRAFPTLMTAHLHSNCRLAQRFEGPQYGYAADIEILDCRSP